MTAASTELNAEEKRQQQNREDPAAFHTRDMVNDQHKQKILKYPKLTLRKSSKGLKLIFRKDAFSKTSRIKIFLILQFLNTPTCQKRKQTKKPKKNRKPPAS